jgi:hypothetical protein
VLCFPTERIPIGITLHETLYVFFVELDVMSTSESSQRREAERSETDNLSVDVSTFTVKNSKFNTIYLNVQAVQQIQNNVRAVNKPNYQSIFLKYVATGGTLNQAASRAACS